jgi:hypothetical protein
MLGSVLAFAVCVEIYDAAEMAGEVKREPRLMARQDLVITEHGLSVYPTTYPWFVYMCEDPKTDRRKQSVNDIQQSTPRRRFQGLLRFCPGCLDFSLEFY